MSKYKFTPGPWEVIHTDDNLCMSMTIIAPKGLFLGGETFGMLSNEQPEKLGKLIAVTFHQLDPIVGFDACERDEDDGNAHLIASAPEMYEALEKFNEQLNRSLTCTTEGELGKAVAWICNEGKALIDRVLLKAQGGQQ